VDAIDEGWVAYHNEVLRTENPYQKRKISFENQPNDPNYDDHVAWDLGWEEAEAEELVWELQYGN